MGPGVRYTLSTIPSPVSPLTTGHIHDVTIKASADCSLSVVGIDCLAGRMRRAWQESEVSPNEYLQYPGSGNKSV